MSTINRKRISRGRNAQDGVTLIELVIAVAIMVVGLFGMAQLFIAASFNNALAVNSSAALTEAQRQIENARFTAVYTGCSTIKSSTTTINTQPNPSRQDVYVIDNTGNLVAPASGTMTLPTDLDAIYGTAATKTKAPSAQSRIIIVRMTPLNANAKLNKVITLVSVVNGKA